MWEGVGGGIGVNLKFKVETKMMWSACSLFRQALRPIDLHGGQARECDD